MAVRQSTNPFHELASVMGTAIEEAIAVDNPIEVIYIVVNSPIRCGWLAWMTLGSNTLSTAMEAPMVPI